MHTVYIREYGRISALLDNGPPCQEEGGVRLGREDFAYLKGMALGNFGEESTALLRLRGGRGGECLQTQNYAGVLFLPSGHALEILPKICLSHDSDVYEQTKTIFCKLLSALPDARFRTLNEARLATGPVPLQELFIACFLQETCKLIRQGLICGYLDREENSPFLRGKLLVAQQACHNAARHHRFYSRYGEFVPDIPENRLLKSALLQALTLSRNMGNSRLCRTYLQLLEEIPASPLPMQDLANCRRDRNSIHYEQVLAWCRLLLLGTAPLPQAGSHHCLSLVFPMEKLFEQYVAQRVKRDARLRDWTILSQKANRHLVEEHQGQPLHRLKPDLLLTKHGQHIVIDTKWKQISRSNTVSSDDLYQLFAYTIKYRNNDGVGLSFLIYPKTEQFRVHFPPFRFHGEDAGLYAIPYDLETDQCPLLHLIEEHCA